MEKKNTVTQAQIENLVKESLIEYTTLGDRTTLVRMILPNGFELIEASSCVDPANYDVEIGREVAMNKIVEHLWELEGYRLACELYERKNQDGPDV